MVSAAVCEVGGLDLNTWSVLWTQCLDWNGNDE
jgi:hypothetical protein